MSSIVMYHYYCIDCVTILLNTKIYSVKPDLTQNAPIILNKKIAVFKKNNENLT